MNTPIMQYDYKKACKRADRASDIGSVLGFVVFFLLLVLCATQWPSDECITDRECDSEMSSGQEN